MAAGIEPEATGGVERRVFSDRMGGLCSSSPVPVLGSLLVASLRRNAGGTAASSEKSQDG